MYYEDFLKCLYKSLIGIEEHSNNIIRKNAKNLDKLGDFSFSIATLTNLPHSTFSVNLDQITQLLFDESRKWPLKIVKCIHSDDIVRIFLDRISTTKMVIQQVLELQCRYGTYRIPFKKNIFLWTDFDESNLSNLDLSQLRIVLLKSTANNLLQLNECNEEASVVSESLHMPLALVNKTRHKNVIVCGSVMGGRNITAQQFYRKRSIDMRLMAEHKYGLRIAGDMGWQTIWEKLGEAAVTMELLQSKLNRTVAVNINDPTTSNSKGASFILYNCARLATLFKEFDIRVTHKMYPALPGINEIDFALLNQPEEWELLFCYVLQYPHTVSSCIKDILKCTVNVQYLFCALSRMCSIFSIYYRRIRILTEPRAVHLSGVLHARIYLLKAVEQVLHNGLFLLNIQPVTQM